MNKAFRETIQPQTDERRRAAWEYISRINGVEGCQSLIGGIGGTRDFRASILCSPMALVAVLASYLTEIEQEASEGYMIDVATYLVDLVRDLITAYHTTEEREIPL